MRTSRVPCLFKDLAKARRSYQEYLQQNPQSFLLFFVLLRCLLEDEDGGSSGGWSVLWLHLELSLEINLQLKWRLLVENATDVGTKRKGLRGTAAGSRGRLCAAALAAVLLCDSTVD